MFYVGWGFIGSRGFGESREYVWDVLYCSLVFLGLASFVVESRSISFELFEVMGGWEGYLGILGGRGIKFFSSDEFRLDFVIERDFVLRYFFRVVFLRS